MSTLLRSSAVFLFAGAVALGASAPAALAHESQTGVIADSCRAVLGLQPGEEHYVNCMQNLQASQDDFAHGQALGLARSSCLDQGLKPGSAELAVCTLKTKTSAAPPRAIPVSTATKSWPYASFDERREREQLACARLGLDPTSGGFDSCVAGLAAALFAADNPQP